jgi:crotonobetainyl-CoA:carnitine CoA-transferase CaiB-like acyl-CoA transferase
MTAQPKKQALQGIRVIDLGHILAGPMTSSMLADFGADVIHVENPANVDFRAKRDGVQNDARNQRGYDIINRSKRNITLDMHKPQACELFHKLVAVSDALTENFRPYVLPRWGHDWKTLHAINPRLIFCRLSGYGVTGPKQHRRAYGRIGEAYSGWAYMNGDEKGPALHSAFSWGDTLEAIWATNAIIAALYWRDAQGGGEGMLIDQGLVEPLYRSIEQQIIIYDQTGISPRRFGTQHEGTPYAGVCKTKDGRYFSWSAPTATYIRNLLGALGLAGDARFNEFNACTANREQFQQAVSGWMAARDLDEIWRVFEKSQAIGAPVMSGEDLCSDPHVKARDMLVSMPNPAGGKDIVMQGIVPKLSETPGEMPRANEAMGARNEEIYCGLLGLSKQELQDLQAAGVI